MSGPVIASILVVVVIIIVFWTCWLVWLHNWKIHEQQRKTIGVYIEVNDQKLWGIIRNLKPHGKKGK